MTTLQALFSLYAEEFFIQHPKLKENLQSHVKAIDEAWEKSEPEAVCTAHSELTKLFESSNVIKKLNEFNKKNEESPRIASVQYCGGCSVLRSAKQPPQH